MSVMPARPSIVPLPSAPVEVPALRIAARDPGAPAPAEWLVAGKRLYLIGIGGCGMSGLARMLMARGALVTGSDSTPQDTTEALAAQGVHVDFDQAGAGLPEAVDLVICSAAIKPDHPQVLAAKRRAIPTLTYAEALGQCMLGRTAVCIAGTHGKSTTTSMLSCILSDAGLDPTTIVGATCAQLGGADGRAGGGGGGGGGFRLGAPAIPSGARAGQPGLLLAESCEFNRSFHNYHPTIAVVTSVEADHLDIYGSLDEVVKAFGDFARLTAPAARGGVLLIAHEGAHKREVTAGVTADVQTIGFSPEADWVVTHDVATRRTTLRGPACPRAISWTTNMPGAHNAMNAATAAAIALTLGADAARVAPSLSAFGGVDRRTQRLGDRAHPLGGTVRIYDDYGHHPTEVASTLRALRQFELAGAPGRTPGAGGRLICVFQPHQHSRTRHLLDEFATAFGEADVVIVPDIYFVRDSQIEKQKISAADLVDVLRARGVQAIHMHPFEAIVEQLDNLTRPGDLLVVMGAGPVYKVGHAYLAKNDTQKKMKVEG